MGGSILFTSSNTFDPTLYGLTTGKFINYIIVGGGGAGGSCGYVKYWTSTSEYSWYGEHMAYDTGGSNGQTSSIGDYVSATGGSTGAGRVMAYAGTENSVPYCDGGAGGYGWIPGKTFNSYSSGGQPVGMTTSSTSNLRDAFYIYEDGDYRILRDRYGNGMAPAITSYPKTRGITTSADTTHMAQGTPNPYSLVQSQGTAGQGDDGIGYGAGGGGHLQYSSYPAFGGVGGSGG